MPGVAKKTKEQVLRREVLRERLLKHWIDQKVKKDKGQEKWH